MTHVERGESNLHQVIQSDQTWSPIFGGYLIVLKGSRELTHHPKEVTIAELLGVPHEGCENLGRHREKKNMAVATWMSRVPEVGMDQMVW